MGGGAAIAQDDHDYTLGPRDTLRIDVFNQPDLSGRYTVGTDGALSFPLIGRIAASGTTLRKFEQALTDSLAAGYLRNPRVSVTVEDYQSQRVFIVGEVRQPGAYPLAGELRLLELLALAGSVTASAAEQVVVVRAGTEGPVLPEDGAGVETVRVELGALQNGDLSENLALRHGDTVFVPEADVVYVFGEVHNPGRYPIRADTIVLQALSLAGGEHGVRRPQPDPHPSDVGWRAGGTQGGSRSEGAARRHHSGSAEVLLIPDGDTRTRRVRRRLGLRGRRAARPRLSPRALQAALGWGSPSSRWSSRARSFTS